MKMMDTAIEKEWVFLSIVIPTFNRSALLSRCIKSLLAQNYPSEKFEIIVVDDGSSDETEALLQRLAFDHGKIKYFRNEQNRGAAASRNAGFSQAVGELIVCLDDDCLVERYWLKDLVKTFSDFPYASAVGGGVINPTDSNLAQASHLLEFSSWLPLGSARRVNNIPTCNIAYKKSDIQGFTFPEGSKEAVYEDTLFNYHLITSGGVIIFNPLIKVHHYKWAQNFNKNDFYENQTRYAIGFLKGGFKAHGVWGRFLMKYKVFNLLCPRLIFVFLRCARSKTYLCQFIRNFQLILSGEKFRNKIIYRGLN